MASQTYQETLSYRAAARRPGSVLGRLVARVRTAVADWRDRNATIGQMSRLDDRLLDDLGVTRDDIGAIVEALARRRSARTGGGHDAPHRLPAGTRYPAGHG